MHTGWLIRLAPPVPDAEDEDPPLRPPPADHVDESTLPTTETNAVASEPTLDPALMSREEGGPESPPAPQPDAPQAPPPGAEPPTAADEVRPAGVEPPTPTPAPSEPAGPGRRVSAGGVEKAAVPGPAPPAQPVTGGVGAEDTEGARKGSLPSAPPSVPATSAPEGEAPRPPSPADVSVARTSITTAPDMSRASLEPAAPPPHRRRSSRVKPPPVEDEPTAFVLAASEDPAPDPEEGGVNPPGDPAREPSKRSSIEAIQTEADVEFYEMPDPPRTPDPVAKLTPEQEVIVPTFEDRSRALEDMGWEQYIDPETGAPYFYQAHTGISSWTHPLGDDPAALSPPGTAEGRGQGGYSMALVPAAGTGELPFHEHHGALSETGTGALALPVDWQELYDPSTSVKYYYNTTTGTSQYEHPLELPLSEGWEEVYDDATGQMFYQNPTTGETQWHRPPSAGEQPAQEAYASLPLSSHWQEVYDPDTSQMYYHNSATGESRWDDPSQPAQAAGWQEVYDPTSGQLYYFNQELNETKWAAQQPYQAPVATSQDYDQSHLYMKQAMDGYNYALAVAPAATPYAPVAPGVDLGQLGELQQQAGAEIEELQRSIVQQSGLVNKLERSMEELRPLSWQV
jgi:hypothetical protein